MPLEIPQDVAALTTKRKIEVTPETQQLLAERLRAVTEFVGATQYFAEQQFISGSRGVLDSGSFCVDDGQGGSYQMKRDHRDPKVGKWIFFHRPKLDFVSTNPQEGADEYMELDSRKVGGILEAGPILKYSNDVEGLVCSGQYGSLPDELKIREYDLAKPETYFEELPTGVLFRWTELIVAEAGKEKEKDDGLRSWRENTFLR